MTDSTNGHTDGHPPSSVSDRTAKIVLRSFWAGCAVLVVLDFLYHRHEVHPLEGIRAFYPLYGFLGVGGLILLSIVLRKLVMRPEDYYDDE